MERAKRNSKEILKKKRWVSSQPTPRDTARGNQRCKMYKTGEDSLSLEPTHAHEIYLCCACASACGIEFTGPVWIPAERIVRPRCLRADMYYSIVRTQTFTKRHTHRSDRYPDGTASLEQGSLHIGATRSAEGVSTRSEPGDAVIPTGKGRVHCWIVYVLPRGCTVVDAEPIKA